MVLSFSIGKNHSEFNGQFPAILDKDPRASTFHDEIPALVQGKLPPSNILSGNGLPILLLPGSSDIRFNLVIQHDDAASVKFDLSAYRSGAASIPENYPNWNVTTDALMITFDEYQVAPYAAGAQIIVMPYRELQAAIDPQGPLGRISQ